MKSHIRLMFACTLTIMFYTLLSPLMSVDETLGTLFVRFAFSASLALIGTYLFTTMSKRTD